MKPAPALRGGNAAQGPCFAKMLYEKEESFFFAREKKLNAVVNHPLPGGARLTTLTLKRPGVGLLNEGELVTVVNVERDDKDCRTLNEIRRNESQIVAI